MDTSTSNPPNQAERATLTEKEFAQTVGISVTTCKVLRKANKLAHCKVGRRILYLNPKHVQQFLNSIERDPRAA